MGRKIQFSLRALLGLLTLAAVSAWAATLFGVLDVMAVLFLAFPTLAGVLFRKPLEGCLLSAFLLIVVVFGAFIVVGILAD